MKKRIYAIILLVLVMTACQPVDINAPAPVYDTGIDPETWTTIPAGAFFEGQFNHQAVIENDYEMMVTTVTNQQFAVFLNSALSDGSVKLVDNQIVGYYPGDKFNNGRHEEEIKAGDYIYIQVDQPALRLSFTGELFSALETWQNHPMTMVSWFGAKAYCEYYGWRLPTAMEWEKAARGTDIRPFPWGFELARNNANFIFSRDPFEDMSTFGSRTTPVGFYNGGIYDGYQTLDSASPYGIYDMAGNVWQWTGDIYDQQHYRYMRGGSKDLYQNNLRIWVSNNATPTYTSPGVGFRCAR
jgi:formylglycine-generating enzyme required for sulfatase activity